MENNRASKRFRTVIFSLTALMILFAWVHSCFPADLSSMESEGVFQIIYNFFHMFGAGAELTETIIRKLAHFTEFTAIGALLLSCAYCFDRERPYRFTVPVLFTGLMAALTDETIQLFVEGRAGMIADVWIDLGGVAFGSLVMLAFYTLYRRRKKRKKKPIGGKYGKGSSSGK